MKKLLITAVLSFGLLQTAAMAAESAPLQFTKDTSGKYIFCNSNEFIRRSDLADVSNENPRYIMN